MLLWCYLSEDKGLRKNTEVLWLKFLHGKACRKQDNIDGSRSSGFLLVVDDGRKGNRLAFSCVIKVQRIGKGSRMTEATNVVVSANKAEAAIREQPDDGPVHDVCTFRIYCTSAP